MDKESRYKAPALTKGIEILELLSLAHKELTAVEISSALKRSVSEIYRMLQVLEELGYISKNENGFSLTNRLLAMSMGRPSIRSLVAAAFPIMHNVSHASRQSCHLAVESGAEMVVIAGVEAPGFFGFAVRPGYRQPLHRSSSGRILLAFQSLNARQLMIDEIRDSGEPIDDQALATELNTIVRDGGSVAPSPIFAGITDLAVPICIAGQARAALAVPFVEGPGAYTDIDAVQTLISCAAQRIAKAIVSGGASDGPKQ